MAFPGNGRKEHAFVTIGRDLKEGGIPNLLLLCGEETYLIQWALDLITSKTIQQTAQIMDFSALDGKETSWQEIIRHCETLPMFSSMRIVAVRDFIPAQPKEIMEDLLHLPDTTRLIFIENGPWDRSKKTGLPGLVNATGRVYEFDALDETQLKAFIHKRLKAGGKTIKPSVLAMLISATTYGDRDSSYNLYKMENDIKKMISHSRSDEITAGDVTACLSETIETNTFAMLDAICKNRKEEAFRLLHDILRSGENPYRLLASIATQMELMLCVKELRLEGCSPQEIKNLLKVHELRIKKALGFSEKFSPNELKTILMHLYQVDKQIKTGVLEAEMALELMIAQV